jgi:hypothetical protein
LASLLGSPDAFCVIPDVFLEATLGLPSEELTLLTALILAFLAKQFVIQVTRERQVALAGWSSDRTVNQVTCLVAWKLVPSDSRMQVALAG